MIRLFHNGISQTSAKLRAVSTATPAIIGAALFAELDEVEKPESMLRTPVRYGDLRDSHETQGPEFKGKTIRVWISVGKGKSEIYALYVHEDLEAFHRVGQAKFLESTLRESSSYMGERIARRLDFSRV